MLAELYQRGLVDEVQMNELRIAFESLTPLHYVVYSAISLPDYEHPDRLDDKALIITVGRHDNPVDNKYSN